MEWINVKDKLPPYNKRVIGHKQQGVAVFECVRVSTDIEGERWKSDGVILPNEITHWMHFPDPPRTNHE